MLLCAIHPANSQWKQNCRTWRKHSKMKIWSINAAWRNWIRTSRSLSNTTVSNSFNFYFKHIQKQNFKWTKNNAHLVIINWLDIQDLHYLRILSDCKKAFQYFKVTLLKQVQCYLVELPLNQKVLLYKLDLLTSM